MAFSVDTVFVWVTDLNAASEWYQRLGVEAGPGRARIATFRDPDGNDIQLLERYG